MSSAADSLKNVEQGSDLWVVINTLDSWGFSPLNQINRSNVSRLRMVWTRGMGPGSIQETTPLVYRGVMYNPNPSDLIQALDARTGRLLWEYKRQYPEGVRGGTNRTLAIWGTTLIDAGADNSMYAIDARTGKLVWETQVLEPRLPARASSGPIVAALSWLQGTLLGNVATAVAVMAVAAVGFMMLTGRLNWRFGATVIIGVFILFGAASIVAGIQGAAAGA